MTFALILLCLALLTLAVLLVRQLGLTRKAQEGLAEWKRLYEKTHTDQATLLSRCRELERHNRDLSARLDRVPERAAARFLGLQEQKMDEPTPTLLEEPETTAVAASEPLTLILPIQLLSKNARDKLHYRARHKLRQDYQDIIRTKYPRRGEPPRVKQRAIVTRILGSREREFDQQNIGAGSAVELIDALTAAGYWVDDAPRWLETEFRQDSSPTIKGPAVMVEIRSL